MSQPEMFLLVAAGLMAAGAGYLALLELIGSRWLRLLIGSVMGVVIALGLTLVTIPRPGPDNPPNPTLAILFFVGAILRLLYRKLRTRLED